MKDVTKIKTCELADLTGRTVHIGSIRDGNYELIAAKDVNTGDFFVLKEIRHDDALAAGDKE